MGFLKSLVKVVKSNIGGSASLEEAAREAPKTPESISSI